MLRFTTLASVLVLLGSCQAPVVEVDVPLAVVNWSPQDGATGVCPNWPVSVCFNQPIETASLGNFLLGAAAQCEPGSPIENGGTVDAAVQRADMASPNGSPYCVVLTPPPAGLTLSGCYVIEVEGEDLNAGSGATGLLADGGSVVLPVTLRSLFQVATSSDSCLTAPDAG